MRHKRGCQKFGKPLTLTNWLFGKPIIMVYRGITPTVAILKNASEDKNDMTPSLVVRE
jgi:hypothetical protein